MVGKINKHFFPGTLQKTSLRAMVNWSSHSLAITRHNHQKGSLERKKPGSWTQDLTFTSQRAYCYHFHSPDATHLGVQQQGKAQPTADGHTKCNGLTSFCCTSCNQRYVSQGDSCLFNGQANSLVLMK